MKTILMTLPIFLLSFLLSAQTPYDTGMQKAYDLYSSGKMDEAANLFERIGSAEQDEWLPYYYVAHVIILKSWNTKDEKLLKAQLDKAQEFINLAQTYSPENPEIMVLQAYLHTNWVAFDGQKYAMTLGPKVSAIYEKALKIAPDNPRVNFAKTEWDMGTARYFGKDLSPYCHDLEKAVKLFDTFTAEEKFYPSWGKDRAEQVASSCKVSK
ncbi:MAG: hypothetical protein WBG71_11640 [Leeuwenhoekiella sp.]